MAEGAAKQGSARARCLQLQASSMPASPESVTVKETASAASQPTAVSTWTAPTPFVAAPAARRLVSAAAA